MLIVGGLLAAGAALLAGTSGFGLALVATPMLLLAGFSLPFVVTVNLLISLATRLPGGLAASWCYRPAACCAPRGGGGPGLWIGSRTLGTVDVHDLQVAVGVVVALAAVALALPERHQLLPQVRGLPVAAGFAGGLLGTTTSLIGIPPALLLTIVGFRPAASSPISPSTSSRRLRSAS